MKDHYNKFMSYQGNLLQKYLAQISCKEEEWFDDMLKKNK